jgi:molybdopterin converting factor subunit 1
MSEDLTVSVRFFALYREKAGRSEARLRVPAGSTVADVVGALRSETGDLPERPSVAVNQAYVALDHPVSDGDEVALIPPVAGG